MIRFFRQASPKLSPYLFILPALYLLVYFLSMQANGSFYLTRIDPDYVYLLNGLNSGILKFDRIGHVDHPGTPFQVFLGACLDLIHLFSGRGNLVEDVLIRPEFYMRNSSHILAVIFAFLLVWGGRVGASAGIWGIILIQLTPFYTGIVPDLSLRLMADRFGFMLAFSTAIILLHWLKSPGAANIKSVIIPGLLTGITIATKIIFGPLFILGFITLKNRLVYSVFTVLGFIVGILPILNRFKDFKFFLNKVVTHDGIYGSGNDQIFNLGALIQNLKYLITLNPFLYLVFLLAVVTIIFFTWWHKVKLDTRGRFILGFILSVLVASIMVAKHFKNYYIINVVILIGPALFIIFDLWSPRRLNFLTLIIAITFSIQTIMNEFQINGIRSQKHFEREADRKALDDARGNSDFMMIRPEWFWGPSPEYGLIFGLTYVRHRHKYSEEINKLFPTVLTFEGPDKNPKRMRVVDVELAELAGKSLLIVDQKNRRTPELVKYLEDHFEITNIDTLPMHTDNQLLKIRLDSLK